MRVVVTLNELGPVELHVDQKGDDDAITFALTDVHAVIAHMENVVASLRALDHTDVVFREPKAKPPEIVKVTSS